MTATPDRHPSPSVPPFDRVPGLDLMRAAAVLLVLASHWSGHLGPWFGVPVPRALAFAGDAGVDLFFALSGFLIGRILIGLVDPRPTWRGLGVFLARRAIRTLPLYFLWLALLLSVFPPTREAGATALRLATMTQNLLGPMPPDYYFAVAWSLAVEEWFYLLFGAALVLAARRIGGPPALAWCLAAFLLVPLALRLWCGGRPEMVVFRLDEIACGVLMARLSLRGGAPFRHPRISLALGLGLMGVAACAPAPVAGEWTWWAALLPNAVVAGGALCLPAALRLERAPAWFERPVRWLATRSYALYLIHLTILVDLVETGLWEPGLWPAPLCALLAVGLPFPLAELSYRFVETPLLRLRPRQGSAPVSRPAPLGGAALV